MQQTVEKYVQQEQKQSIVNVYLKENQRHVFFFNSQRTSQNS
jgi:membrane-bound lytic murein transglycosylase